MVPPDFPVSHQGSQLSRVVGTRVSLQRVDVVGFGAASSSLSMRGFPENGLVRTQLRVALAVSSESQSSGRDLVAEGRQLAIQGVVRHMGAPVNIDSFPQHSCISAVERLLICVRQRPCLTSVQQDGLHCCDENFLL